MTASTLPIDPNLLLSTHAEAMRQGRMTNDLAKILLRMAKSLSYHDHFRNYSHRDELPSFAMEVACQHWHKFDYKYATNDQARTMFNFFTKMFFRAYYLYNTIQRKSNIARQLLMVEAGL